MNREREVSSTLVLYSLFHRVALRRREIEMLRRPIDTGFGTESTLGHHKLTTFFVQPAEFAFYYVS